MVQHVNVILLRNAHYQCLDRITAPLNESDVRRGANGSELLAQFVRGWRINKCAYTSAIRSTIDMVVMRIVLLVAMLLLVAAGTVVVAEESTQACQELTEKCVGHDHVSQWLFACRLADVACRLDALAPSEAILMAV